MSEPSKDTIKKYLNRPEFCPYCKSINLTNGEPEFSAHSNECYVEISCMDCGIEWVDVYTLTSFVKGNPFNSL